LPDAIFLGEAMLELSQNGESWTLGYGGDTLNTAVHLARAGIDIGYFTAMGVDEFSKQVTWKWQAEGLDTSLVLTHPARIGGLYAISCDTSGERSFTYWRGESAAREMFDCPGTAAACETVAKARLFGFSLISLAILNDRGRNKVLEMARGVRDAGGMVAFDGNYRPQLWPDPETAQLWRNRAIEVASVGLPTQEDEEALSGLASASAIAEHWRGLGCVEVIVKMGVQGASLGGGPVIAPPQRLEAIDTSGAGDAFNAGYLAARLSGASLEVATLRGHQLAGWCVMQRGAIPPRPRSPLANPYAALRH